MDKTEAYTLAKIKERIDIIQLISQYMNLKKAGRNYKGLCPFHQEKTPSFTVNAEKQFFHCFGCGASGDVFQFVMQMEGLSFPEVVEKLAEEAGVEIPKARSTGRAEEKNRLHELHAKAASLFHTFLKDSEMGKDARKLALSRGLTSQAWDKFLLGFAPDSWDLLRKMFKKEGFSNKEMLQAGLLSERESGGEPYVRFRKRLMIPIWDHKGRVVAFGGRALGEDQEPKYLNSPEHLLFRKGEVLYPYHMARKAIIEYGSVLIVEGYMDAISCHLHGLENTLAALGTALTLSQARKVSNLASSVYLCYDGDEAGEKASLRAAQVLFTLGIIPKAVVLPPSQDPDSILRERGKNSFRSYIEGAQDIILWYMEKLKGRYSLRIPSERARWVKEMLAFLEPLREEVLRDIYLVEISNQVKVPIETLKKHFSKRVGTSLPRLEVVGNSWELKLIALSIFYQDLWEDMEKWGELLTDEKAINLWRKMLESPHPSNFVASLEEGDRALIGKNLVGLPCEEKTFLKQCLGRLERRRLEKEAREIKERMTSATDPEKRKLCERYVEIMRHIKGDGGELYEIH